MIRGAEYAVARVIAILQASLPAELNLIDSERSDGITLDDVDNSRYYDYHAENGYIDNYPAICVTAEATDPIGIGSTINSPGVYNCEHLIRVSVIHKNAGNEGVSPLCKRNKRTALAIERVIAIKNPTLGGTVLSAIREGTISYVETGQEPESYVVTSHAPFKVRTYKNL